MLNKIKKAILTFFGIEKPKKKSVTNRPRWTHGPNATKHKSSTNPQPSTPKHASSPKKNDTRTQPQSKRKPKESKPRQEKPISVPVLAKKVPEMPKLIEIAPQEGKVRFADLGLHPQILAGFQHLKFEYATPVQAQAIPLLKQNHDIIGKSQTGTGKTAAFLASIFDNFLQNPRSDLKPGMCRALVLAPTRELAIQIGKDADAIGKYTPCTNYVVYGGMDHTKQMKVLESQPIDILIGTPGRLIDYIRGGQLKLQETEVLVIDEADRMLDMGFIPDVTRIVSRMKPAGTRHTLFFSATFTPEVMHLATRWLQNPDTIEIQSDKVVTDLITQKFYSVLREDKFKLLLWFLRHEPYERILVFGNRKDFNSDLTHKLHKAGIKCELLSGDVPQEKRLKVLERFRRGDIKILVATDVAARGIHVDGISHVINYDLPVQAEDYVHRIGRTGRAGASGTSISFICEHGAYMIEDLEKFIGAEIISIQPTEEMLAESV